ncbi:MAG: hypothetical protein WC788_06595 [Candidatus Paceibacterota bacterium]
MWNELVIAFILVSIAAFLFALAKKAADDYVNNIYDRDSFDSVVAVFFFAVGLAFLVVAFGYAKEYAIIPSAMFTILAVLMKKFKKTP